jgi:hypothetical protein
LGYADLVSNHARRVCVLALLLVACKANRGKLEELVPDGATGIVSFDAQAILKSELYAKTKVFLDAQPEAKAQLDALKSECGLDVESAQSYVSGFDVAGQNFLLAIRMPNIGKKSALECALGKMPKDDGVKITITEVDGRAALEIGDGVGKGWGWDDDTLVIASKGWTEAVQQRMKGEGKAAVDHYLKDAVALADRGRHVWFAGEMPALVAPFLDDTPAKGLLRVAGGIDVGTDFDVVAVAGFADEATAKSAKDTVQGLVDGGKAMAIEQGVPKTAVDSLVFEQDGSLVRMKVKVPIGELVDSSTSAFTKYMQRSKTSEARVQLAKMFDAASAYFNEEQVARGSVDAAVVHACPNDGRGEGETGITPPLSVDCSKGCEPTTYGMQLWTDNPVWNGLNFQLEQRHYFHYNFKWKNTPGGFGACQFTAQAFGDLDGDGVYSTFERAGAADEMGVNAAAGLFVDREVE